MKDTGTVIQVEVGDSYTHYDELEITYLNITDWISRARIQQPHESYMSLAVL